MSNPIFRKLWWALLASQLVYVVVAYAKAPLHPATVPIEILTFALALVSLATAIGTTIYRRKALVDPIQAGRLDPGTPQGRVKTFMPFIINLALSESLAIYGVLLTLLSGRMIYCAAFTAGSLLLFYVHRPTAPDLTPRTSSAPQRE
jgi:hypothetical protein